MFHWGEVVRAVQCLLDEFGWIFKPSLALSKDQGIKQRIPILQKNGNRVLGNRSWAAKGSYLLKHLGKQQELKNLKLQMFCDKGKNIQGSPVGANF